VEVSCDPASPACAENGKATSIGLATPDGPGRDVACVVENPSAIQSMGDSPCIYSGMGPRFVIYRGQAPSARDMQFGWEVRGGFVHLAVALATRNDPNALPQSMVFSKELGQLVIADGESKGLVVFDLSTFGLNQYY
jgi:hypothetical protein